MKVLFVTTFNKEIYSASAKQMIESFIENEVEGDMLACYEGFNFPKFLKKESNVIAYDLDKDKFLYNWLNENKDVIQPELGGTASIKKTPEAFLPWNLRFAGWFRKIASLNYAKEMYGAKYDAIVFVDADCKFTDKVTSKQIFKAFNGTNAFYHWGKERVKKNLGVETGFVGFAKIDHNYILLDIWINKFKNKVFRRYMRWDDGGVFGYVVLENEAILKHDLVEDYADNNKSQSHVIERGMFRNYLVHEKGLHKRLGITNEKNR